MNACIYIVFLFCIFHNLHCIICYYETIQTTTQVQGSLGKDKIHDEDVTKAMTSTQSIIVAKTTTEEPCPAPPTCPPAPTCPVCPAVATCLVDTSMPQCTSTSSPITSCGLAQQAIPAPPQPVVYQPVVPPPPQVVYNPAAIQVGAQQVIYNPWMQAFGYQAVPQHVG